MPNPARNDLIMAKNVLLLRRANTADAAEQATIDSALGVLNSAIDTIDQASLLQAAGLVASATDSLERVVASTRMRPFDNFLSDIQVAMAALEQRLDEMQGAERLPNANDPRAARASVTSSAPSTVGDDVPTPIASKDFGELREEYAKFFESCRLRPEFSENVEFYVSRLIKNKTVYQQLAASLNNMPWLFIGVVHGLECGFNFGTHLHNGDPLTGRTIHKPAGRPVAGQPPFTWLESARDALQLKGVHQVTDWNLPRMLYMLEAYNGFGYRWRGVPSPYLWSFSNIYNSGKFVSDGRFDPNAVSKQCGAAVMLRVMQDRGLS